VIARRAARRAALAAASGLLAASLLACHHTPPAGTAAHAASPTAVERLQHDIDRILSVPELERGYWGVVAESLGTGETLYSRNGNKLMMPASTMKIVTLAAAARRLGWDFTYETRLVACGAVGAGVLDGDLVAIGSGDPTLDVKNAAAVFDEWADGLKAAGIHTIAGRIVGDDAAFDREALGMGWSWDDLQDGYAAGIGALQFNENAARLAISPGNAAGDAAIVGIEPETSGLTIHNQIVTAAAADAPEIRARRQPGSSVLELDGRVPLGAAPRHQAVSVDSPARFFVQTLRTALIERGIDVQGPAVALDDIKAPGDRPKVEAGRLVVSYRSPPLSVMAAAMMKTSENMYAETLLKTLGAGDGPATIDAGRRSVEAALEEWGIDAGDMIERDGSGLSRYDYVTPGMLAAILTRVDRDGSLRGPFESSLPIAGVDGTLANRLKGTAAEGRVRAKTGSMSNVRALAGYVAGAGGEPIVFAIIANNFDAPPDTINKATDAIVVALAAFRR